MIPLIPSLALAFFSFLCSAFVILRIVIPILPPHPLSRRVAPVCRLFSAGYHVPDQLCSLNSVFLTFALYLQLTRGALYHDVGNRR